ncbi:TetR family transcriptional regulator [Epidermidibacterium keratini]|uniref:TetR family transcriptional regulator n=1 Tax=Epidermidibacterium keratini TaxID=1891644 RepID=A0A7L4YN05_9ACTN|nr:TetR/AcrR family transcriptional regulator [Epidermidibacterium keratini]QHC00458.1 TetR family transcriptional regulator [Epidermidibacterium keratini]
MAKQNDRREGRRNEILDAAAALFATSGYHGARMDDIVRRSGLSKGTLYWYFSSKEEIATALVDRELAEQGVAIERVLAVEADPRIQLETLVRAFANGLAENPDAARLTLELLSLGHSAPDIGRRFVEHHRTFLKQIEGIALGIMGEDDAERAPEAAAASTALAALVDGFALRVAMNPGEPDLADRLWAATNLIVEGIAPSREPH